MPAISVNTAEFAPAEGYRRVALGVEYCGASYNGWQKQAHTNNTVQYALEKALAKVADHSVDVVCAGRTDSGVHGLGQVVHFDCKVDRPAVAWLRGTNHHLPDSVAVLWAQNAEPGFHARFSATSRSYVYAVLNRQARPAALAGRVTWCRNELDVERMHEAAQALLGEHDFAAFQASSCQSRSSFRHMMQLDVRREGPFVVFYVQANAFLHHMVRNLVGVLMEIGQGGKPVQWAAEVLESRSRCAGGITAKPHGLYLASANYPADMDVPAPSGDVLANWLGVPL